MLTYILNQIPPEPRRRAKIALPTHLKANGRFLFYGFDISREWLMDYARQNLGEGVHDRLKVNSAVRALRLRTGIKRLALESGLVDSTLPAGTITITGGREVPLLSIFSNERWSYERRPSQAQIDELSQILGKQPRWWIDYEDPRSYE
jgi:hypothetical protein